MLEITIGTTDKLVTHFENLLSLQNRTRTSREAEVPRKPSSPSQSVGYSTGPLKYSSLPPFPVSFFMLRVDVNSSFTIEVSQKIWKNQILKNFVFRKGSSTLAFACPTFAPIQTLKQ